MPSNGVIHKHLSLLRPQPHSVIDTTDTSDASTTHREGLCVCVHVSVCMCAIVCMYVYTCTSTERYMYKAGGCNQSTDTVQNSPNKSRG